jgi:hypothetical protein
MKYRVINRDRTRPPQCEGGAGKTVLAKTMPTDRPHGEGCTCEYSPDGYDFEFDLRPVINGDVPLPNFEPLDLGLIVNNLASIGHGLRPEWGHAWVDPLERHKTWAFYFLSSDGMASPVGNNPSFGGGGYVLIYTPSHKPARAGRFAICKHEVRPRADADPRRGWRPGHCRHCGLDMTIDSSD